MKKRDASLDSVAGLLIIYMILIHIFQWSDLRDVIHSYWLLPLSFFMSWFFYKSGMFYKDKTCKELLVGGGKKLLIPYVVFSLVGHILQCVKMFMEGDANWVHYILSPVKQIMLSLLILSVGSIDFRANGMGKESYMLPVLFSLCGCIVINNLFRKGQWRIGVLEYVGERAISFYVLHWLVLLAFQIVLSLCGANDKMMFLCVSIISCCVILTIVTRVIGTGTLIHPFINNR